MSLFYESTAQWILLKPSRIPAFLQKYLRFVECRKLDDASWSVYSFLQHVVWHVHISSSSFYYIQSECLMLLWEKTQLCQVIWKLLHLLTGHYPFSSGISIFFPEQTETTAMQIKATSSSHLQEIPKTRSDHKTWKTVGHPFSWLLSKRWVSTLENDAKHSQREDQRIRYLLPEHPKTYCYLNCSRTNARRTQIHLLCWSLTSLTKKTVPVLTSFSRTWTYFNFLGSVILGRVTS